MEHKLSPTETLSFNKKTIDRMDITEALTVMLQSNNEVIEAIKLALFDIEKVILSIYNHLLKSDDGRLIYAGAGTSGRIGVQDGVELYPTFGWPRERVNFLIAGGVEALTASIENAEDNILAANENLKTLKVNSNDVIIGIAASGNTPYTNSILKGSRTLGALTIGISNNPDGIILKTADMGITLNTNSELIAGSTRLKAGTSQKICLNIISNMLMIKMGRVKDGLMTHLVVSNKKLEKRKKWIDSMINK
tara:strand:+ start:221 stop:970 length:750 start_codon:yes stop_codon:yes gene_type:complete